MRKKKTQKLYYFATALLSLAIIAAVGARLCGYSLFAVTGSSMQPDYPPRSVVVVKKTDFSSLNIGDRIVFSSIALGGQHAFHRIINIDEDGVYTKGDNNVSPDKTPVTKDNFVGKEAFRITLFSRLVALIKGNIFLLFMPLAALLLTVTAVKMLRQKQT